MTNIGYGKNVSNYYSYWPTYLVTVTVVSLGIIGLYWETAASMAKTWWHSETYAHGIVIIPIVVYLIWLERDNLVQLKPFSKPVGLVVLASLCLLWLLAAIVDVQVIQQFALVAMAPVLTYSLLGPKIAWTLTFPLAFLFFMVPVGEGLVAPLMDFTATFTVKGLQLTGIPVYWQGHLITIPSGHFEVAEACSGIRYLIASVSLGTLYAYLVYRSLWRRLAFIALAIVLPIIANGIRAYGIVMLAHLSDRHLAVGIDHIIYGWVFFGFVLMLMFWIGSWWREPEEEQEPPLTEFKHPEPITNGGNKKRALGVGLAALALAASAPLAALWLNQGIDEQQTVTLQAPIAPQPWLSARAQALDWTPQYSGAAAELRQSYSYAGKPLDLYIAYYQRQRQGHELINSYKNKLYDRDRWRYSRSTIRTFEAPDSSPMADSFAFNELVLNSYEHKMVVWFWYWVGGYTTTSSVIAKLLEAWDRLSGARRGAAIVAVAADFDLEKSEADQVLMQFLNDMRAPLSATLLRRQ